ncbi:MAG: hypothetical protein HY599_01450 [Candidatus Omnitrophica bacterium]|nr:hypothetical protein [Candidatus Omnitrophota bacterium]
MQTTERVRPVAVAMLLLAGNASTGLTFDEWYGERAEMISDQVKTELITEHASIQPGGKTRVGVHFEIEEGWHIYAKEPGDAGLPTKITWSGPAAVSFGPLEYPSPQQFIDPGDIRTNGYSGSVVLYSAITFNPLRRTDGGPYEDLPLRARVQWLACKDVCIPGKTELELSLPVSANPPVHSTHAEFFDHTS